MCLQHNLNLQPPSFNIPDSDGFCGFERDHPTSLKKRDVRSYIYRYTLQEMVRSFHAEGLTTKNIRTSNILPHLKGLSTGLHKLIPN